MEFGSPPRKDDLELREKSSISQPSRWLSVKKKGPNSRSKSREPKPRDDDRSADSGEWLKPERLEKEKSHPLSGDGFRNMFKNSDKEKGKNKEKIIDETDSNLAVPRISEVQQKLEEMHVSAEVKEIKRALTSPYSQGDPTTAARLIDIWQKSQAGTVVPYDKNVQMQGAVNVNMVTCYLDALFFSMFAKLAVFECMLSFDFPKDKSGKRKRLSRLLCLWVNLVRSGFLVREDVTRDITNALAALGWTEAAEIQQQDTTEAFNFITDVLEFPLQPLRMSIHHGGDRDKDDDKIEFERLLNIAIPSIPPEGGVKLEECLTAYFNAEPVRLDREWEEGMKKKVDQEGSIWKLPLVKTTAVEPVPEKEETPTEVVASPLSIHAPEVPKEDEADHDRSRDEDDDRTPERTEPKPEETDTEDRETETETQAVAALKRTDSKMNGYDSTSNGPNGEASTDQSIAASKQGEQQPSEEKPALENQQTKGVHFAPSSSIAAAEGLRRSSQHSASDGSLVRADTVSSGRPSRDRASSVIQDVYIDENNNQIIIDETTRARLKRQGSSVVKAIRVPAWKFYRLVPWHNVKGQPTSDFEVAAEFQKRPVVGVCLKRYAFTNDGRSHRLETHVDIPEEMKIPYTLISEEQNGPSGGQRSLPRDYKFVLQSVICHRGSSLSAGHYISFARVDPKKLRENRRHDFDPPPDYEQAQWLRHDDLDEGGRVQYIPNFQEAIKTEFPYLLFYQVVPLQDDAPPPSDSSETSDEPPSYEENFRLSVDEPSTPVPTGNNIGAAHREQVSPDAKHLQSPSRHTSKPSSIRSRPSMEADRSRKGSDDSRRPSRNPFSSRPASMNLDSAMNSPVRTPDARDSPMLGPSDESTASRLSRAAAAFRGKQSRNSSQQPSESRSAGADMINRMTGMLRAASREPLGEPPSMNLSNANSRAGTNARTSVDSTYRPSLEVYREEMNLDRAPKAGGFLSRTGSKTKRDKRGKNKESKGDKTPRNETDQPDRECNVM